MSLKKDWGYMKNIMRTPCRDGSIDIYVEAAVAAGGLAAFDLLSFGCREPVKHAAGRGQAAEWFGTGNRRSTGLSGHRRPRGKGIAKGPTIRSGQSFFWHFEGLFERTLFYFLLASIGEEFAVNWTSLVYGAAGCGGPYAGFCEFNVQPQVIGPGQTQMLIGALPDCHGVLSDIRSVYIPQGLSCDVSYHVKSVPWAPANNPGATLISHLEDDQTGQAWAGAEQGQPGSGDNGVVGFQKNLPGVALGFRKISIVGTGAGGYVWCPEGKLQITLQGRRVPFVNLTDCFRQPGPKRQGER